MACFRVLEAKQILVPGYKIHLTAQKMDIRKDFPCNYVITQAFYPMSLELSLILYSWSIPTQVSIYFHLQLNLLRWRRLVDALYSVNRINKQCQHLYVTDERCALDISLPRC